MRSDESYKYATLFPWPVFIRIRNFSSTSRIIRLVLTKESRKDILFVKRISDAKLVRETLEDSLGRKFLPSAT